MSNIDTLRKNIAKVEDAKKGIKVFLESIFDEKSFVETDVFSSGKYFLDGSDALGEGIVTGYGSFGEQPVCFAAQNYEVLKGSVSRAHIDKYLRCMKRASDSRLPLISVFDSDGARLGEGLSLLEGYGELITTASSLKNYIPHIAIVKGNAIGFNGMLASICDFIFVSEKAGALSFGAPQAVLAREGLNAKANEAFGVASIKTESNLPIISYKDVNDLREKLKQLFDYILADVLDSDDDPNRTSDDLNEDKSSSKILSALCDDGKYFELNPDYSPEVLTAFTSVNNIPLGIVVTNNEGKGDLLSVKSIKKIKKFVKLLENYQMPLITVVDCKGLSGKTNEEREGLVLMGARLISAVSKADIKKLAVISGSCYGIAYTALSSKSVGFDYSIAFPDADIAVVDPKIAVEVLYNEEIKSQTESGRDKVLEKFNAEYANPFVSAKAGYIDNIIEPALLRPYVTNALYMLLG